MQATSHDRRCRNISTPMVMTCRGQCVRRQQRRRRLNVSMWHHVYGPFQNASVVSVPKWIWDGDFGPFSKIDPTKIEISRRSMRVDRTCAMLQSYFPGHGFDPKGTLEKRQSQRGIRLERGTTSKSVYFHLWTFFRNYNLPIRYMHKKLNLGTGTGVFMPQLQR
jgi:hypothetical protein